MPSKKNKKTNNDGQIKENISEAANLIPGLIVEHAKFEDDKQYHNEPEKKEKVEMYTEDFVAEQNAKKRIVYSGVLVLASVVLFIWVMNAQVMIKGTLTNTGTDEGVLVNTKNDLSELIHSFRKDVNKSVVEEASASPEEISELKNAIISAVANGNVNDSSADEDEVDSEVESDEISEEELADKKNNN